MRTLCNDHLPCKDRHDQRPSRATEPDPPTAHRLAVPVRRAICRTRQWLLEQQHADGYWVAELEGDTILVSEYILLSAYVGREDSELARRAAERLLEKQLPEGGWAKYPGGAVDIDSSVKAYFALKLTGHDAAAEYMQRARQAILAHGGADASGSYTRFYLALLGQISYDECPAVPPEMILLPRWFPVNLYSVSAWSRTIFVPLSIISAFRPVRRFDPCRGIRELFIRRPCDWPPLRCPDLPGGTGLISWDRFFRTVDRLLKWCRRHRLVPLRGRAIRAAHQWMLARLPHGDGLGSIFPPIVFGIVALRCLGYDDDSPELGECHRQLENLIIEDEQEDEHTGPIRLQPSTSPVWDTAITLCSLAAGGIRPDNPAVGRAVDWLLEKQILDRGDWSETVAAEPGGWCFQYTNRFYPDCDDTAMVLMALHAQFDKAAERADKLPPELRLMDDPDAGTAERPQKRIERMEKTTQAINRAVQWLLAMQNDDGGWGAFDRNNNRGFLCHVPFADHNAMIDPSTPDLTGRMLETLGTLGHQLGDPSVDRAVDYLRRTQKPNGSWFGRWGVNYVYGTWQVLTGLAAVGVHGDDPAMTAGANWLLDSQQSCGGWGESPDSYLRPDAHGQGPPTASQTAWALMGLLAAGMEHHPAVARGIQFLVDRQCDDGIWEEDEFTGTGFPKVFYLRYHYYPIYFPLLALSRWAVTAAASLAEATPPELRLVTAEEENQPELAVGRL